MTQFQLLLSASTLFPSLYYLFPHFYFFFSHFPLPCACPPQEGDVTDGWEQHFCAVISCAVGLGRVLGRLGCQLSCGHLFIFQSYDCGSGLWLSSPLLLLAVLHSIPTHISWGISLFKCTHKCSSYTVFSAVNFWAKGIIHVKLYSAFY